VRPVSRHIRIDKDLPEDKRTLALADEILAELRRLTGCNALPGNGSELGNALFAISRVAALGSVTRLWIHADTHVRENDVLDVGLPALSEVTALPLWLLQKFSDEWLRVTENGVTQLPAYIDKNALISREKRRTQARLRVRRWRRKHKKSVTPLHGKRGKKRNAVTAKTCNADVTHPRAGARARATGNGIGTVPTGTGNETGTDTGSAALAAAQEAAAPRGTFATDFARRFGKPPEPGSKT
jgi:hypothetical protein